MDDHALFQASVPVFQHYVAQLDGILAKATQADLEVNLADDGFSAGTHFSIAQNYVLRVICPLIGDGIDELSEATDKATLIENGVTVQAFLAGLSPATFAGAQARVVKHQAGFADHRQSAADFLTLYGLPNFFFHLVNAYAILRQNGVNIGKGDFDGLHTYPPGFSFATQSVELA